MTDVEIPSPMKVNSKCQKRSLLYYLGKLSWRWEVVQEKIIAADSIDKDKFEAVEFFENHAEGSLKGYCTMIDSKPIRIYLEKKRYRPYPPRFSTPSGSVTTGTNNRATNPVSHQYSAEQSRHAQTTHEHAPHQHHMTVQSPVHAPCPSPQSPQPTNSTHQRICLNSNDSNTLGAMTNTSRRKTPLPTGSLGSMSQNQLQQQPNNPSPIISTEQSASDPYEERNSTPQDGRNEISQVGTPSHSSSPPDNFNYDIETDSDRSEIIDQESSSEQKSNSLCKLYGIDKNLNRRPFLDGLLSFMEERRTPITACPMISKKPLDLYRLYELVKARDGFLEVCKVTQRNIWEEVAREIGASSSVACTLRKHYTENLLPFECHFDRGDIDPLALIQQVKAGSKKKTRQARRPRKPTESSYSKLTGAVDDLIKTACKKGLVTSGDRLTRFQLLEKVKESLEKQPKSTCTCQHQ